MAAINWKVLFYHLLVFAIYMVALTYDTWYLDMSPNRRTYGGRFKYLTFWNELIHTAYFGYSVFNDIFGSNIDKEELDTNGDTRSGLQRFRDFIAAAIVFPLSLFVVATFWGLYAVDRELVFPAVLDKIVPPLLNHIWHTFVIIFLVLERFVIYHHYPSRASGLTAGFIFSLIYQVWILWIAYHANIWVYPVFEVLQWPQRICFLASCWILLVVFYLVGERFTSVVWDSSSSAAKEKVK